MAPELKSQASFEVTESDKHASVLRLGINYHGKKSQSCGPALSGVSQDSDFVAAIKLGASAIRHYGLVIYRELRDLVVSQCFFYCKSTTRYLEKTYSLVQNV